MIDMIAKNDFISSGECSSKTKNSVRTDASSRF